MRVKFAATALATLLVSAGPAMATTIEYQATDLGGGKWEYTYNVKNDSSSPVLSGSLEDFLVYFAYGQFDNLLVTGTPVNWISQAINPSAINLDGYFEGYTTTDPIPVGGSLDSFKVSFDWLGSGTPGAQLFEIYDANLNLLGSGTTVPMSPTPPGVPEPATWLLFASGMMGLIYTRLNRVRRMQS